MIQWEYEIRHERGLIAYGSHPGSEVTKEAKLFNEMGKDGWELCSTCPDAYTGRFYYFKRQVAKTEQQNK